MLGGVKQIIAVHQRLLDLPPNPFRIIVGIIVNLNVRLLDLGVNIEIMTEGSLDITLLVDRELIVLLILLADHGGISIVIILPGIEMNIMNHLPVALIILPRAARVMSPRHVILSEIVCMSLLSGDHLVMVTEDGRIVHHLRLIVYNIDHHSVTECLLQVFLGQLVSLLHLNR